MNQGEWILVIVESLIAVGVSFVLFEGISRLIQRRARRAGVHALTLQQIRRTFRIVWIAVAALAVADLAGFGSPLTFVTLSGIAGLAAALSLQATLSSMISGLFLWADGAIRLGDEIEFGGVHGTVVRIALRNTWVMTEGGSIAIIGNTALAGGPIVNHTATDRFLATGRTSAAPVEEAPPPGSGSPRPPGG